MEKQVCILSTKKLLSNQKQYLLNAGFSVLEADFIAVKNGPFDFKDIKENFIFTSQNAVRSFLQHEEAGNYTGRKAFCVGIKTKEAAESAGFVIEAATDYAEELAEIITAKYENYSFTFFCGNLRRETLPEALRAAGIDFNEIQVYETMLTPHSVKRAIDGILFFSPSGVESYLKENHVTDEVCFCIGTTTAKALEGVSENIAAANKPTIENLIIQCINYYKNKK